MTWLRDNNTHCGELPDPFGKSDDRPMKGSWAPGEYSNKCQECDERFTGDKRARSCADCAYKSNTVE